MPADLCDIVIPQTGHSPSALAWRRPAGVNLSLASALHIRVDRFDRRHIHAQGAPCRHPLRWTSGAHCLHEELLGIDRTIGPEGDDEMWRDGRALHVFAVAAGAV